MKKLINFCLNIIILSAFSTGGSQSLAHTGDGYVKYSKNKRAAIAISFEQPMQCVIDELKNKGFNPRAVGCFGFRPNNRSKHPSGHACDVDQWGRNLTMLNKYFSVGTQINMANKCNAASGCKWRNKDCGHFESRSAPNLRAGAAIARRDYYGPKDNSFKKRSHQSNRKA